MRRYAIQLFLVISDGMRLPEVVHYHTLRSIWLAVAVGSVCVCSQPIIGS